jgi:pSer/pThr/pTyr-binding forkhead associated (FHA) protein
MHARRGISAGSLVAVRLVIRLGWDPEVSRVHALLLRVGGAWTVVDDGLSRNGTFVNGARVLGRHRLCDRDVVRCGSVSLQFREPTAPDGDETITAAQEASARLMSPAQRRVLVALCRPLAQAPHGLPATNKQIACELSLSVDAVKTHLRNLAELLEVEDLPQNQKRAQLAWRALSKGLVCARELPAA